MIFFDYLRFFIAKLYIGLTKYLHQLISQYPVFHVTKTRDMQVHIAKISMQHGQGIERTSSYHRKDKEKSQDNKKTFSWREALFRDERDHEWGPYPCHHGEKVQGQGNVSLPWIQYAYHDHIEKPG